MLISEYVSTCEPTHSQNSGSMLSIDQHAALLIQRFNDEVSLEYPDSLSLRSDRHRLDNEIVLEVKTWNAHYYGLED
jgi:hypothetical protein